MGVVSQLCANTPIPKMAPVRQIFDRPRIAAEDIPETIRQAFAAPYYREKIQPGMRVAITAGSRGIANIALITKCVADFVRSCGASPFVVPAMGSHGGATAEGQLEVLHSYGITEEYLGCPILSSMETVHIGDTSEGHHVRIDKNAFEADGIIVVNRVKPHTAFRGPYESGIMKMMTIGLGKQAGAESCHESGFGEMAHLVELFGSLILEKANILFALAILENAYDETSKLVPLQKEEIKAKEPALLVEAKALMPRIRFDAVDVLIVDEIGKNFSGDGQDPNITGRFLTPYADGGIQAQRMVVLDLSEETHGNGCGLGLADITTRRAFEKFDLEMTYPNVITSTVLHAANIPLILDSDADAIRLAIRSCNKIDKANPRIVRIANSLHIEHIWVSEVLLPEVEASPYMEQEGPAEPMPFDAQGNLW